MDKNIKTDFETINSGEWKFLLFVMFMEDIKQRSFQWKDFEDELIYKNRFTIKHKIIDEIHDCKESAVKIIRKETVLYRARIFSKISFDKLVKYYLQEYGYSKCDIEKILAEWTNEEKLLSLIPKIYSEYDYNETPELVKARKKWKQYVRYKGWNAKESGAPSADLIGNGRANPDHIRYLYLCEDAITPVYEVRPIIGDTVSVAKFRLKKDVRLYDLTLNIQNMMNSEVVGLPRLYNTIGEMFSKPYNGDATKYLPTQYIAEEIKNMGFDGLRFRSSLHEEGINIVLFNPEDCTAFASDLVEVKGINLNIDDSVIYKIGTSRLKSEMTELNWERK